MSRIIESEDGIKVREFEFLSSNMYTPIHGKLWIPKGDIKAIVQISHGMQEHIDRYDEFARYLAKKGILVAGNSHMGHGDSVNSKEDYGYFSIPIKGMSKKQKINHDSSANVVKDLYHITKVVKKHYSGVPYILLGHSMGSFMIRRYLMQYGNVVDGAIIIGTGNQPEKLLKAGRMIVNGITAIKGERFRSNLTNDILFGAYNREIEHPLSKEDWICSDRETIEKYRKDEKCGFLFTMNGIEALLSTMEYIIKDENIARLPRDVKMFLASGKEDPVGNYGEDVEEIYEAYKRLGVKDISMKLYDGCRHEILNETIKETVYEDIYNWIVNHILRNSISSTKCTK